MTAAGFASRFTGDSAWSGHPAPTRAMLPTQRRAPEPLLPREPLPRSRTPPAMLIVIARGGVMVLSGQGAPATARKGLGLESAADRTADHAVGRAAPALIVG